MKQVVEIREIEEFMVDLPIHKYVKNILNVNCMSFRNEYIIQIRKSFILYIFIVMAMLLKIKIRFVNY